MPGSRIVVQTSAVFGIWLAACAAAVAQAVPPERVALINAKIIPVVGARVEKGTVLIEHGRIAAIGEDVQVPYDARVFDCAGKVVFPGMVNVHAFGGTDVSNERRQIVPQLTVADSLDPSQLFFEDQLRLGHTVVHVIPGHSTCIGGLGLVVRPIGMTPAEMTLAESAFMKLSVSPTFAADRMLQLAQMRDTFDALAPYVEKLAEQRYEESLKEQEKQIDVGPSEAAQRGLELIRPDDVDIEHRNLLRLTGGTVKLGDKEGPKLFEPLGAFIYCSQAMDVAAAVALSKKYGFFDRMVLVLGGECFKAVSELKAAARPVVLPSEPVYREVDPVTGKLRETFVPRAIADAGLEFALLPGSDTSLPERQLNYQAARLVREGISRDLALRAITLYPAKMLGLGDRLGSIEVGKDAHLVVFSGDPLDFTSVVERVLINGIPAYDRTQDVRLQKLLSAPPPASQPTP